MESILQGDKADLRVVSDRRRIKQVILNLLSNSQKFTNHGSITVSVIENRAGDLTFYVKDTGRGMSPEDK